MKVRSTLFFTKGQSIFHGHIFIAYWANFVIWNVVSIYMGLLWFWWQSMLLFL